MASEEGSAASEAADLASVNAMGRRVMSLVSWFSMAFGLTLVLTEIIACSNAVSPLRSPSLIPALFFVGIFSFTFGFAVRRVVLQEKKLLPTGFHASSICSLKSPSETAYHIANFKGLLVASGILGIVLGALTICGEVMYREIVEQAEPLDIMCLFTGMACGFILTGVATIIAVYKPSRCWIVLSMILNMTSMGMSITLEVFIWQEYFYNSRDIAMTTSSIQIMVIMTKMAPPFPLIFLSTFNACSMIFALIRVGGRMEDTPMPKSLSLRPCNRTLLAVSGSGLFLSGLALIANTVSLLTIGNYDLYSSQRFDYILAPGFSVAGLSFGTGIAVLTLTRLQRFVSSTRVMVFLLGVATVGVSIYSLTWTVELYNDKMYSELTVREDGIREVNGTMQFCVCRKPERSEGYDTWRRYKDSLPSEYACIAMDKFCDGVVDMTGPHYRMCAGSTASNYYNTDEWDAPDESYCFKSWKPLFAAQFALFTLSVVAAAVVAALNVLSAVATVLKSVGSAMIAFDAALDGLEVKVKELNVVKVMVEEDRKEITKEEQLSE